MTIEGALLSCEKDFRAAGYETPRLDALVLLAANMKKDKAFLFSHGEKELSREEETAYEKMRELRASGLPVAYIVSRKEFYGLSFYVDERVLVPRPETETLVDTALGIIRRELQAARIHDVCTGTGCIAIALAQTLCGADGARVEISASDISPAALDVFRLNCNELLGRLLPHSAADLLSEAPAGLDIITANPPYISAADFRAMRARGWPEPELALNGGDDGLDIIRRLAAEAAGHLWKDGWLVMEASPEQAADIQSMLENRRWRDIQVIRDLTGQERVIAARRP
ncbi:MAG: peptide chain release factor N(5)-glutamine methyltransferase [Spirochaetaceae bacterium]|nr:peptide chain release factor N(5)-glutamine methyltransferase [Spirochaetaceae bacterium]